MRVGQVTVNTHIIFFGLICSGAKCLKLVYLVLVVVHVDSVVSRVSDPMNFYTEFG
jgi:hypothetical protein